MGFQFVHIETYARKADRLGRSVAWVLDEAERREGSCPHVTNPQTAELVHGMALADVRRLHDEAAESHVVTLANGKTRALRKDQKTLATVVASHPATMEEVRANPSVAVDVAKWEQRTVAWLAGQYGDRLLSVVRHTDEAHAHLHAYVVPDDLRASRLHPGAEAKRILVDAGPREGEDAKALNRRGDAAYKSALREWQDSYWQHVGLPHLRAGGNLWPCLRSRRMTTAGRIARPRNTNSARRACCAIVVGRNSDVTATVLLLSHVS